MTRLHIGVAFGERGAGLVYANHRLLAPDQPTTSPWGPRKRYASWVTRIERPPDEFEAMLAKVAEIAEETSAEAPLLVIDWFGDGAALYHTLAEARRAGELALPRRPTLYRGAGADRQELNTVLKQRLHDGSVRFADRLEHRTALDRAVSSRPRIVKDDGIVGGELCVALALSLIYRRSGAQPEAVGRDGLVYPSVQQAKDAGTHAWY